LNPLRRKRADKLGRKESHYRNGQKWKSRLHETRQLNQGKDRPPGRARGRRNRAKKRAGKIRWNRI